MTVCIAAAYKQEGISRDGLVFVTDWQETDESTHLTSQGGWKLNIIAPHIVALGADDMVKFHDIIGRIQDKAPFDDLASLTVRQAAQLYLDAEREYRMDYIERHVLTRFGLTWKIYFDKIAKNELPQSYVDNIKEATDAVEVPYSTEAIIAGLEEMHGGLVTQARIFKITPHSFDDHTQKGYAVIGSGDLIADAEFKTGLYNQHLPLHSVASFCMFAKKRSEVLSSVGDETGLWMLEKGNGIVDSIDWRIRTEIEREYGTIQKRRESNDKKAFGRSKKYFDRFPKPSTRQVKRTEQKKGTDTDK